MFGQTCGTKDEESYKDVMTVRTEYPYQTLKIRTKDDTMVMDLWIAYVRSTLSSAPIAPSACCRSAARKSPSCWMPPGRCSCGLPSAFSRKIAGSWSASRKRTTGRAPITTTRCFRSSSICVRFLMERGVPARAQAGKGGLDGRRVHLIQPVQELPAS
ncbi:Vanillate O-demethylase oxygenase subunit [Candidatus Burkholderia brachyanthoides]|nr:Vanillate O-demethylase oxygenase subunit [Candidatus Burkholderia brachyanthoides]